MPIHLKPRQSKRGAHIKIKDYDSSLKYELREVFVGNHTLFSLLGFAVGGILVGRSLWEYGIIYLGLPITTLVGIIIFIVSGIILKSFHK